MTQHLRYRKKIVFSLLVITLGITVSGQQPEPVNKMTRQDYLQKSKNQKTTGWILLGGGTAMAVVGAIVFGQSDWLSEDDPNTDLGGFLFVGGIVADLVSIPFFISSSSNARKAAAISLITKEYFTRAKMVLL